MVDRQYTLVAEVSSADPAAIEPLLRTLVRGTVTRTVDGFHVEAALSGSSARDLNRALLSALRRAERRTRLRSSWTAAGLTERFFDYIPKGVRLAAP